MAALPTLPPVSLGISPSSSASTGTGLDNFGGYGGGYTGAINVGSGASQSWASGLVRDLVIGAGALMAVRYLWRKL